MQNKTTNKLIDEKSPYLLQHAHNPVNWYPWGEEAFKKAKEENKPIFLSIGYSTCHWCHVMEKESFEDIEVAKLLNENFVSIKVDREERPDIDHIYMMVCQIMTKSGGWPLNVILNPEKKPFFAGTYFPKDSMYGRIGMMDLIPRLADAWKNKPDEIKLSADEITKVVQNSTVSKSNKEVGLETLDISCAQLLKNFDKENGGFGAAPKFPTVQNIMFLLRYYKRSENKEALNVALKSLKSMSKGGIYDHVGFGFHRYSTDEKWLVPHFEKMLYDQAMICMAYLEAYQITKDESFAEIAKNIITYVLRDMRDSEGGFYSAEDADSEGEEGKFYLWSEKELDEVLGKDAKRLKDIYNTSEEGNFLEESTRKYTGTNILYLKEAVNDSDKEFLEAARKKLFNVREKRIHPYKDDKILADWNGLMIVVLSKASQIFSSKEYEDAAKKSVQFISSKMLKDGEKLIHRYRDGEANLTSCFDDYAFIIWGLLELYETTFDIKCLELLIKLQDHSIEHFWDKEKGGFFFTPDYGEELIARKKEIYDGAVPSGNSVAFLNLVRIYEITGDSKYNDYAIKLNKVFYDEVVNAPFAYNQFLSAVDFAHGPRKEIVIVGEKDSKEVEQYLREIRGRFIPNKVVLLKNSDDVCSIAPYLKNLKMSDGKVTAYICEDFSCKTPVNDIDAFVELINK